MTTLDQVVAYLDQTLDTAQIPDYRGAVNGLQFANSGKVTHVAAAVDFSSRSVQAAVAAGADMLLVHHGMFWGGARPIVGRAYDRVRALIQHDVAVYSSHLPLDLHAEFGNNPLLARYLGLAPSAGFARFEQITVGVQGESSVPTRQIVDAARRLASEHGGSVVVTPFAPDRITRRWALCTGAGASTETLAEAARGGIDTLIVGEGPQHTAVEAIDSGLAVIYAGHYATETLGVRTLAEHLAKRFGLRSSFLDLPTGL